ncbi:MAG: Glucosamine-1-phosphate N-acetyltransferase [Candidatus Moranbacteria bacterium GW2011_GWA2_39_41]|nr:MAG: Glucosamine-1-phosphate N-acetyltransferase [Candidatus Moranbacteria bacterium GW2011_GWA2_39_41]
MQVVILAAGRGKRMQDLTKGVPKPMLKIKGKPILEHKINMLPKEVTEIVFVIGYYGEHIMNHFKHYFGGRKVTYVFQTDLNGTGGALFLAKSVLRDKFLVMMGDDLYHKKDLNKLIKHDLAILGREVEDDSKFGIIKTNSKGHMIEVVEKPKRSKDKLANTGVYVLNKKIFDYDLVPIGGGEFGLPQTMAKMSKDYPVKVEAATIWHTIGNPEDLIEAEKIIHKFEEKQRATEIVKVAKPKKILKITKIKKLNGN